MYTCVVGDLHLGTHRNREDELISQWIIHRLAGNGVRHLIMNGDTFELAFCIGGRVEPASHELVLGKILEEHRALFECIRQSFDKVTIVVGEHDYLVFNVLRQMLYNTLGGKLDVVEHHYHSPSRTLVLHGHQFDYNLVHDYSSEEILTDRLTRVFEQFTFQTPELSRAVMRAFEKQAYSFWYAAGRQPAFIDATCEMFGHRQEVYYRCMSAILRSDFFKQWVHRHRNTFNKCVGFLAVPMSIAPWWVLRYLNRLWWAMAKTIVLKRAKVFLRGGRIASLIDVPPGLPIDRMVVGHAHRYRRIDFDHAGRQKTYVNTVSPRWHLVGLRNGELELHRDEGYVILGDDGSFNYHGGRETQMVRVHEAFPESDVPAIAPAS